MSINVKMDYVTIVRIENDYQHDYVINGQEPDITFVSFRDTPYNEKVKILEIRSHNTIEDIFTNTNAHVSK